MTSRSESIVDSFVEERMERFGRNLLLFRFEAYGQSLL